MTLEELARTARGLANELFSNTAEMTCSQPNPGCIRAEEKRPLTIKERGLGWTRRPFDTYEPVRMCRACRAYWFAEMAAQELHEAHCWQRKIAATEGKVNQPSRPATTHGEPS